MNRMKIINAGQLNGGRTVANPAPKTANFRFLNTLDKVLPKSIKKYVSLDDCH